MRIILQVLLGHQARDSGESIVDLDIHHLVPILHHWLKCLEGAAAELGFFLQVLSAVEGIKVEVEVGVARLSHLRGSVELPHSFEVARN